LPFAAVTIKAPLSQGEFLIMADHNCADRRCTFCRATTRRGQASGKTPASSWTALSGAAQQQLANLSRLEQMKTNLTSVSLEEMEELALLDKETGVYNSRELLRCLRKDIAYASRRRTFVSVCVVSLAFPRPLQQQHGQGFETTVLRSAANVIAKCIRETDTVGRSAAKEFAVILSDCNSQSATCFAKRLKFALDQEIRINQGYWSVGLHIAIGCFPGNAKQKDELLEQVRMAAERAMRDNQDIVFV
jgi:diguanylate cyclase (GGDEF)-like protein